MLTLNHPVISWHFLMCLLRSYLIFPPFQISTIASMEKNKKGLAEKFEDAAKLRGVRIFASARFPAGAGADVVEQKVQMVRCLSQLQFENAPHW